MSTLAVTSILLLIFMSNQFVRYLGDAAIGHLTAQAVLQMMCIQVPLLLGFMLPLGLFMGIILAYGRLYVDHEMTVLNACGVSGGQVLKMTMVFATLITTVVALLMLWIEPKMAGYRDQILAAAAVSSPLEKISPGRFQKIGDKWVLFVEKMSRDKHKIKNVFVAQTPLASNAASNSYLDIVYAANAFQSKHPTTHEEFIVLANGYRYVGQPDGSHYQIIQFNEYGVRLPRKLPTMKTLEEFMPTTWLWHQRHSNRLAAAELQWRISIPISVFILALFAVPLSQVKPRRGRFVQLLPAVAIYIVYINLLFVSQAWIQKGRISTIIGVWWIHVLMLSAAILLLFYKGTLFRR